MFQDIIQGNTVHVILPTAQKLLEGPEFEMTLNQQMAPQYFNMWGKVGNFK